MRRDYLNENSSYGGSYIKKIKKITENYTVTEADGATVFIKLAAIELTLTGGNFTLTFLNG